MNDRIHLRALILALGVAACSSEPEPKSAQSQNDKRDTEIKHEPCDGTSSSASKVDVNGDGKPDIIHVMAGGREICRIVDLNLDGAIDAFIYYDEQGRERRRESDFDRDGRADEISIYEGGVIKLKLRETNFDNKIDTWDHYEGGRLVRRERDSDGDAIVDQWWQFNNPQNPKCAVVATDRNADGKPDPESVVDLCAESYGGKAPPSAAPTAAPTAGPAAPPAAPPAGSAAPPAAPPTAAASAPPAPPTAAPSAPPAPPTAAPSAAPAKPPKPQPKK